MVFQRNNAIDSLILEAVGKSLAMIQFTPEGIILDANENFLNALDYRLDEVVGKHHRIFCDRQYTESPAYRQFWADLAQGKSQVAEFRRISKSGKDVWINASYNAVCDSRGKVIRVVKIATVSTAQKLESADFEGQIKAIKRSQAVIEFSLDGTILDANENFLSVMGYTISEIQGKHHRIFVDPAYAQSSEYKKFWSRLNDGDFFSEEFQRFGKGGKEVWIRASYNPINDMNGKPFRVVKYATDITAQKLAHANFEVQMAAVGRTQAIIEFTMDGNIVTANKNFCDCLGYSLDEIVGRHHRMFVDPAEASSPAYAAFWEKLRHGEYDSRVYKRIGKGGREVWIQASYNVIFDASGKPSKVIKFATEVTNIIETGGIAEQGVADAQSVAAAIEEMTASISEISKNMQLSKEAAMGILNDSTQSSAAAAQLGSSMKVMENVVQLINNIAGQVNLLALNATIEAARAGEAGKGFAVVAAEVKNLATQTTKATEDIARQIQEVQSVSQKVAESIETIVTSANNVTQYIVGVASAIEEQSAVTQEISGNTQRMSNAASDIAQRIRALSAF